MRDSNTMPVLVHTLSVSLQNTTSVKQAIFLSPVLFEFFVAAVRRQFMSLSLILCADGWKWKPFPIVTKQTKNKERWGQTKISQEAKSLMQTKMKREAQYESVYSQVSLNFTCIWAISSAFEGSVWFRQLKARLADGEAQR